MAPRKKTVKAALPETAPAFQWAMAMLGGLVTAAIIGVVIWEALQPKAPPALSARIIEVEATSSGHVAVIEVLNEGDDTAAAVHIEGVLGEERPTATVDYVPRRGQAKAFLRFDDDPAGAAVVSVVGWSAP